MDRPGPRSLSSPTLARRKMGGLVLGGLAAPAILCAQPSPPARSLTIAAAAETTSLDPHFQDHDPTITVQRHVYEFLVGQGPRMELVPELAESWRARDPLTWEFRLRRGVVWHDGAPFTAADVIASLKRVPTVENSPSSFVPYVRQITAMEAEATVEPLRNTIHAHPTLYEAVGEAFNAVYGMAINA